MMDGCGKSDSPIVPGKSPNKAPQGAAEGMARASQRSAASQSSKGRGLAKGNPLEQNAPRTQSRSSCAPSALERVRQAARREWVGSLKPCMSSLSLVAFWRYYLRQEPYEAIPHVRI
jgi:hypothetical protein